MLADIQTGICQTDTAVCVLYVQSSTPEDGRKDRPKHEQCHSKINKFDTFIHLVGFTIEITLYNLILIII